MGNRNTDTVKTHAAIALVATMFLSALLPAAELERITPQNYRLVVTPYPDAKPRERRTLSALLYCNQRTVQAITITVYWISVAGNGAASVVKVTPANYTIDTNHNAAYDADSGVHSGLDGWVITARDTHTRALLALKGSRAAYETLARTPGALPEKPGLIVAR